MNNTVHVDKYRDAILAPMVRQWKSGIQEYRDAIWKPLWDFEVWTSDNWRVVPNELLLGVVFLMAVVLK